MFLKLIILLIPVIVSSQNTHPITKNGESRIARQLDTGFEQTSKNDKSPVFAGDEYLPPVSSPLPNSLPQEESRQNVEIKKVVTSEEKTKALCSLPLVSGLCQSQETGLSTQDVRENELLKPSNNLIPPLDESSQSTIIYQRPSTTKASSTEGFSGFSTSASGVSKPIPTSLFNEKKVKVSTQKQPVLKASQATFESNSYLPPQPEFSGAAQTPQADIRPVKEEPEEEPLQQRQEPVQQRQEPVQQRQESQGHHHHHSDDHHHHHHHHTGDICSDPFHSFLCAPLKARKRISGAFPERLRGQTSFIQYQKSLPDRVPSYSNSPPISTIPPFRQTQKTAVTFDFSSSTVVPEKPLSSISKFPRPSPVNSFNKIERKFSSASFESPTYSRPEVTTTPPKPPTTPSRSEVSSFRSTEKQILITPGTAKAQTNEFLPNAAFQSVSVVSETEKPILFPPFGVPFPEEDKYYLPPVPLPLNPSPIPINPSPILLNPSPIPLNPNPVLLNPIPINPSPLPSSSFPAPTISTISNEISSPVPTASPFLQSSGIIRHEQSSTFQPVTQNSFVSTTSSPTLSSFTSLLGEKNTFLQPSTIFELNGNSISTPAQAISSTYNFSPSSTTTSSPFITTSYSPFPSSTPIPFSSTQRHFQSSTNFVSSPQNLFQQFDSSTTTAKPVFENSFSSIPSSYPTSNSASTLKKLESSSTVGLGPYSSPATITHIPVLKTSFASFPSESFSSVINKVESSSTFKPSPTVGVISSGSPSTSTHLPVLKTSFASFPSNTFSSTYKNVESSSTLVPFQSTGFVPSSTFATSTSVPAFKTSFAPSSSNTPNSFSSSTFKKVQASTNFIPSQSTRLVSSKSAATTHSPSAFSTSFVPSPPNPQNSLSSTFEKLQSSSNLAPSQTTRFLSSSTSSTNSAGPILRTSFAPIQSNSFSSSGRKFKSSSTFVSNPEVRYQSHFSTTTTRTPFLKTSFIPLPSSAKNTFSSSQKTQSSSNFIPNISPKLPSSSESFRLQQSSFEDRSYLPPEPNFQPAAAQNDVALASPKVHHHNPFHHGRDLCTDPFHSFLCSSGKPRKRITGALPSGYRPDSSNTKEALIRPDTSFLKLNALIPSPKPVQTFRSQTTSIPRPTTLKPIVTKKPEQLFLQTSEARVANGYKYPKPSNPFPTLPEQNNVELSPSSSNEGYSYPKPAKPFPLPIEAETEPPKTPSPSSSIPSVSLPTTQGQGYQYPRPNKPLQLPEKQGYSYPKPEKRLELPTETKSKPLFPETSSKDSLGSLGSAEFIPVNKIDKDESSNLVRRSRTYGSRLRVRAL